MSKGSPVTPLRIPQDLLDLVRIQIDQSECYRRGEPWTLSSFIRAAILEKLAKMKRSRKPRRKKGRSHNQQVALAERLIVVEIGGVCLKAPEEVLRDIAESNKSDADFAAMLDENFNMVQI